MFMQGIPTNERNMFWNAGKKMFFAIALAMLFAAYVLASSPPNITLVSPPDNAVFNTTNNITFGCNATDDDSVEQIDIYTNINGTFTRSNTSCFGELCADSSTMLLLHFNNNSLAGENDTHTYDWSGKGNNATVFGSPQFNATGGKFFGAYEFYAEGTKYLKIGDSSGLIISSSGAIEFWIYPRDIVSDAYILTKSPGASCTESAYAVILTQGYIEIDFGSNAGDYTYTSQNLLPLGQWSHVAATWNESGVIIYTNNVSSGNILSSGRAGTPHYAPSITNNNNPLWIFTTDTQCITPITYYFSPDYFNGKIDELAIYSRMLTAEEVSEHYSRTLTNNATKNWTLTGVADGTYMWNCKSYDNDSQSSFAPANYTFHVDMTTPPTQNSATISPSSADELDPGVTITVNANITDVSGVDTAILQYKKPLAGTYTNVTMAYNATTKLYAASFATSVSESGTWKYRTWSNDTLGNGGASNETSIPVEFDRTWSLLIINRTGAISSGLGTTYAYKGSTVKAGSVIINNTGDLMLNFDLTALNVVASYNVTEPFDLDVNTTKDVEISTTAPDGVTELQYQIIINSTGATPPQRIANGTLISYIGGPYLVVSIDSPPSTALQGQAVNLSARVKNIGNETATGVWLNWTLPEGWTNTTGNISEYIGNISSDSSAWNNIGTYISSALVSAGVFHTITASSGSAENKTGSDSKTVGVSCSNTDGTCGKGCSYATDSDCTQPANGGVTGGAIASGTTGGGIFYTQNYKMLLTAPERIDAYREDRAKFRVRVSNPERGTEINGVTISITGYPGVHISIIPGVIQTVYYNETKEFDVEIYIPAYMQYGPKPIGILAAGGGKIILAKNTTPVEAKKELQLVVHSNRENETIETMENASLALEELAEKNIPMTKLTQMMNDAKVSIDAWDYDTALDVSRSVLEAARTALKARENLKKVDSLLRDAEKYGVDARSTTKIYALAETALAREDYARAFERANNALLTSSIEIQGKVIMLNILNTNWKLLALAGAIMSIALFFTYRKLCLAGIKRDIEKLGREETALRSLITAAKKEYFGRRMTKSDYFRLIHDYESRLIDIKKEISGCVQRMSGMMSQEKVKAHFENEEQRIRTMIEDTQKEYFESGKMSRTRYHTIMKELKAELAEAKMNTDLARERKTRRFMGLQFAFTLLALILAAGAGAYAVAAPSNSDASGAADAIKYADAHMAEMKSLGLGTLLVNDTINEAKLRQSKGDYAGAKSLANYVEIIKKTAIRVQGMVDEAEEKIYDASSEGLDVADAKGIFDAGLKAFEAEDYPSAESMLSQAILRTEELRANAELQKTLGKTALGNLKDAAKREWPKLAAGTLAAAWIALFSRKHIMAAKAKKKIIYMEKELEASTRMIRELQKKYYGEGAISKSDYEAGVKKYKEMALHLKKEITLAGSGAKGGAAKQAKKTGQL